MKNMIIAVAICLPFLVGIAGCDFYEAKDVDPIITINYRSVNMYKGETFQLVASPSEAAFTWTSEEPDVAEVSASGLVTAKNAGSTDIIVNSGNQKLNVTITVDAKIPLTDFTLSENSASLRRNGEMSFQVFPEPMNANDYKVIEWRSKNEDIVTVDYKGHAIGRTYGTTEIVCTIVGTEKTITKVIPVEVSIGPRPSTPFKGPHILSAAAPKLLKAADFDYGGRGIAWYDANTGANQGSGTPYRTNNNDNNSGSVGIDGGADGTHIGWTATNEWLVYTVEVEDAGKYIFEVEVACNAASVIRLEIDKESDSWNEWSTLSTVNLPQNNGWGNYKWETASGTITLPAGTVRLRFYFATANCNFRAMRFTRQVPLPEVLTSKDWKLGSWSGQKDPANINTMWWDFRTAVMQDDIFTFNAPNAFIQNDVNSNNANTSSPSATWQLSEEDGKSFLTLSNEGFLGYIWENELNPYIDQKYEVVSYSPTSIRLCRKTGGNAFSFELLPAN